MDQLCALVKMIDMLIQCVDMITSAISDVVNTVAEIAGTVEHGNGHGFQFANRTVIVSKRFHKMCYRKILSVWFGAVHRSALSGDLDIEDGTEKITVAFLRGIRIAVIGNPSDCQYMLAFLGIIN